MPIPTRPIAAIEFVLQSSGLAGKFRGHAQQLLAIIAHCMPSLHGVMQARNLPACSLHILGQALRSEELPMLFSGTGITADDAAGVFEQALKLGKADVGAALEVELKTTRVTASANPVLASGTTLDPVQTAIVAAEGEHAQIAVHFNAARDVLTIAVRFQEPAPDNETALEILQLLGGWTPESGRISPTYPPRSESHSVVMGQAGADGDSRAEVKVVIVY